MKVLVVWYDSFNYLDGIVAAFNANSKITEAKKFPFEFFGRGAKSYERFLRKIGVSFFEKKYYDKIRGKLIDECREYKPKILLILNARYRDIFNDELFAFLKAEEITPIVWFVDSIKIAGEFDKEYLENFAKIYTFEYGDIEHIQKYYDLVNVCYLPLGADTSIYNKQKSSKVEKKYDVCFVGAYDEKRLAVLEYVAEYCVRKNQNMIVFGHMWRNRNWLQNAIYEYKFSKRYSNLHRFVKNEYLLPIEVAKIYAESKICLNIVRAVHDGANPRTFEIMATGAFEIVDYSNKLEMLFENHKHLAMYRNKEELEGLLEYYLNDNQKREEVALVGYDLVMRDYTLINMIDKIVEDAKPLCH